MSQNNEEIKEKKYLAPSLNNRYHTQNVPPILCLILCINSELDMKKKYFARDIEISSLIITHIFLVRRKKTVRPRPTPGARRGATAGTTEL